METFSRLSSDIEKILISDNQIKERTKEIADAIAKDYKGEEVLVVSILRGSVLFFAELVKLIDLDLKFDFMFVSSYGSSTESSGEVKIIKDIAQSIKGKNVLIVEDIIDSGRTLTNLLKVLKTRNPKSIKICTLLDKPSRRVVKLEGDYVGFAIPDEFVVGYGLDYNEKYRNLPHVCILKRSVYEK